MGRILAVRAPDLSDEEIARLSQYPPEDVAPLLMEQFKTANEPYVRGRAFDGLMRLAGFDQVGFLIGMLEEWPDAVWRAIFCERLGAFQDSRAIAALQRVPETDPDGDTRFAAAEALGEIGDLTALEVLARVAKHDQGTDYEGWPVSGAADRALHRIRERLGLNPT